jgi:UDP-glucose 4-epimerase
MRVVVVGATGNVGTAVLRRLAADPSTSIVGVARRVPAAGRQGAVGAPYDAVREWAACDIGAPHSGPRLAELMTGADAVVHLGWAIQPSHAEDVQARTNVEGSQHVVDAAVRAGVPHLVYLSSVGAYAPGLKDRRVDESWPATGVPGSVYSRHKAAVERMLDRTEGAAPDLTVTRLRPGLIFQRQAASEIIRYFLGPLVPFRPLRYVRLPLLPLDERLVFQVVHADDVAEAVAAALAGRAGGAFNLVTEPVVTPTDLAALLGARLVPLDASVLRTAAAASWRLRLQPTHPGWLDLALQAPLLDAGRARRELDWKPAHEALATVDELLAGMVAGAGAGSPPLRPREGLAARLAEAAAGRLPGTRSR